MTARIFRIAVLAALLTGCRQQPEAEAPLDPGQVIYMARCALCHGADREGKPGMYPPLAGAIWVDGFPTPMAAIILDGVQGPLDNFNSVMPAWRATLSDSDIAAVMTWLRRQEGKSPVTPVDVNHVRIITGSRGTFWTEPDLRNLH
ncbi:MAG: c-type cytochrome [Chthoniobacteraceae bacterium]|jgi:mono/diheme cytochrome c family protein